MEVTAVPGTRALFTPQALEFLARLHTRFAPIRRRVLSGRAKRRLSLLNGGALRLSELTEPSMTDWRVADCPPDLLDRRVEIAGPVTPRIAARALASGAQVWIADLEDATTPSWQNLLTAYATLVAVVRDPGDHRRRATIVVRPRGWHLEECHVLVDGEPMAAALVDFGLYFFHCAAELLERGSGPYYYLPKMEDSAEARLWDNVFCLAQELLGLPHGSVRATVIIESITAAFEMSEILYALRDHASGLAAGRWDYLFSVIKNFRHRPEFVLPDRAAVTMTVPFLRAYTELLVDTCHRHGAHAIGGVAAMMPNRDDPEGTARAYDAIRDDKHREADEGFDGSWVVHPDLVAICAEPFTRAFSGRPHQIERRRPGTVTGEDLLAVHRTPGAVTRAGVQANVAVSIRYLQSWLAGNGSARIFGLMEGLATVEIARSQLWQWLHHGIVLDDGTPISAGLIRDIAAQERAELGEDVDLPATLELFERITLGPDFPEFITDHSYPTLLDREIAQLG
ncbi:malate synthase [Micromonospora aurantiaca (nom. illeg.)]|uniref:malate synthase n=1 Tax=Micromonospora aurantiaca (nom. illeg.) TaxID=47850 RepID=UPI0037976AA6